MLIRIVPDMFIDPKYDCKTINEVRKEFISTTRFKEKYPWRKHYTSKVKSTNLINQKKIVQTCDLINLISEDKKNQNTDKFFSLSNVDKQISAQIIEIAGCNISTGDQNLIDFLEQEFDIKNIYPLQIIVEWVKSSLIEWNENIELVLEDWNNKNEKAQPVSAKNELKKLTGFNYSGLVFED